jgi:hypothetical protein
VLLKRLPALTKFYPGLMPWHVERMTLREVVEYIRQMDDALANQ